MHRETVTRKIVATMIATAVMVQSFVVAEQTPCMCSATVDDALAQDACSVTGDSECRCSEKVRNDKTCCCSQKTASHSCCSVAKCCHQESADHRCECGCSDQLPEPVVPADTSSQTLSWELFCEALCSVSRIAQPQSRHIAACSCPSTDHQSQSCSVQVLYCTWLT